MQIIQKTKPAFAIVFVIIIFSIISSCAVKNKSDKPDNDFPGTHADSLVAYIERTRCFGICPNYSVRFYRSGYVLYEGYYNVDKIGRFYAYLPKQDIIDIGMKAEELNYFDLNNEYRNPYLADFPTVYLEVRFRGKLKKITHCDAEPPRELIEMEKYIDSKADNPEISWQVHPDQNFKD
jgi:hypothetical protein